MYEYEKEKPKLFTPDGFEWSARGSRLSGWSMGTRADALKEAREALLKDEART